MAPTRSPNRTVRVAHPLWHAALTRAKQEGVTLSDRIRAWLVEYAAGER